MEIFRILIIVLLFLISNLSCSNRVVKELKDEYQTKDYIIIKDLNNNEYKYLLKDSTVSNEASFIYKGENITPFGNRFVDDSGIHLPLNDSLNYIIVFFKKEKNNWEDYAIAKIGHNDSSKKEIKILKEDMKKIFEPSVYKIYILQNEKPKWTYFLELFY